MTTGKYILDGHIPVECTDLLRWSRWFETSLEKCIVKLDPTPEGKVSTVFLGHSFWHDPSGPPILFETLVFGGPLDGEMQRYATWDEAEKGHELMLARVRAPLLGRRWRWRMYRPTVLLNVGPTPEDFDLSLRSITRNTQILTSFALDSLLPYETPSREALREAGKLYRFLPTFFYVLVGTETIRALAKRALPARRGEEIPTCQWYESTEFQTLAFLPYPSPKNHWYDLPKNKKLATTFLRAAALAGSRANAKFRTAIARTK